MLGMLVSLDSASWVSLFVGLECMYLPLYAMVALRTSDKLAQEAACKYVIMGSFSTGLMLFGVSLLYGCVGSLELSQTAGFLRLIQPDHWSSTWLSVSDAMIMYAAGGLLITIALCFKIGVVPFHLWVRDVYEGSFYYVTALISSLPKCILVVIWLRVFTVSAAAAIPGWSSILLMIGVCLWTFQ